jgi:hypothetical protein
VAQSLEQRLCAVVEILPKFRQRTLGHFVDRQLTGEISADSHELDQASTSATSFGSSTKIWPDVSRRPRPQQSPHATGD